MKLYLVQHAEACVKDVDPERPLTDKGRADNKRLASFLNSAGIQVDRVLHSGKLRARQTAEGLTQVMAPGVELEISECINPNDNPAAFDGQGHSQNTLIVGHLPFVAKLVSLLLIDDDSRPITAYRPGSIVCLERVDMRWQICWMIRPELLS